MYDSTQICGRSIYKEKQYCCSKNIISYLKPVWPWRKVSRSCNQSVAVLKITISFKEHDSLWFGLLTARMKSEVVNSFIGKAFHQYPVNDCEINKKKRIEWQKLSLSLSRTAPSPSTKGRIRIGLRIKERLDWFQRGKKSNSFSIFLCSLQKYGNLVGQLIRGKIILAKIHARDYLWRHLSSSEQIPKMEYFSE